jgi:hypothetical protein
MRTGQGDTQLPHQTAPPLSLENTTISLERTVCFGTCPVYRVSVSGDGHAAYLGILHVDVRGEHHYQVNPRGVARLLESARDKDLWSLRPAYRSSVSDGATYTIVISSGDRMLQIVDYMGEGAGMPAAVTTFEEEIDEVAQTASWMHLGRETLERLTQEHFKFASREGGELLLRAIADMQATDDEAIVQLIQLGAPWRHTRSPDEPLFSRRLGPALEEALMNPRSAVVEALLARGALRSGGLLDRFALDSAFRAAIRGGRYALVRRIWESGGSVHPSLMYTDVHDGKRRRAPVTLELWRIATKAEPRPWDGLAIAQFLLAQGCDIRAHGADGRTLLTMARYAEDQPMIDYLQTAGLKDEE